MVVKFVIIYRTKNARKYRLGVGMVLPDGEQKKIYDHMLILNLKIILFLQKQRVLLCQADQRIEIRQE